MVLNLPSIITVKKDATAGNNKGTIIYTYDAVGNKLQKITNEPTGKVLFNGSQVNTGISTTTDYFAGFVYESKSYTDATVNAAMSYTAKLQFAGHEEGRIRPNYNGQVLTGFAFDYMIKDHLGNVRMVLTDEVQVDHYPTATLETNAVAQEQKYYDINADFVVANPVGVWLLTPTIMAPITPLPLVHPALIAKKCTS